MSSLLWPGDQRCEALFADSAVLDAMAGVEDAWLAELIEVGIAPTSAAQDLAALVRPADVATVAAAAEDGGNPLIPFLDVLRERARSHDGEAARWLHRGLTSQDVVDSALMICARDAVAVVQSSLRQQIESLAALADRHRSTLQVARTLTQHAAPTTFGVKAAGWLSGVLDAAEDLAAVAYPLQLGGAVGTLAAPVELARLAKLDDPVAVALDLAERVAARLGLAPAPPWHTSRAPITRLGDALARCLDSQGRIANDVLTLARPEIGELAEPRGEGRGTSSAMPQKANPVLSVLIRRAALTGPALVAQLHLAAAEAVDERPDGAWHVEWPALQLLCRRTVVATAQGAELVGGLRVDAARMRANLDHSRDVLAEAGSIRQLFGVDDPPDPAEYLGAGQQLIDTALARAAGHQEASS